MRGAYIYIPSVTMNPVGICGCVKKKSHRKENDADTLLFKGLII